MKNKKTLEEAFEKWADKQFKKGIGYDKIDVLRFGAKWQAKRSYSENEVRELIIKALTHNDHNLCGSLVTAQGEIRTANFGVWFEENKKK